MTDNAMTTHPTSCACALCHSEGVGAYVQTRTMTRLRGVKPGDEVRIKLPWSEVCLHLRVADQVRRVRVLEYGAEILNDDGTPFSFPISLGEAGISSVLCVEDDEPTLMTTVTETVYRGNYLSRQRRLLRAVYRASAVGAPREHALRQALMRLNLACVGY